ncbi:MAG: TetR/AcrR family transcriptional regulator [Pseudomonadales bacterium]|jgi:AcrR family transcriptional regulator|nr:TetR/AcrR family transcriptional regulator [Pseudomonadales bacterium]
MTRTRVAHPGSAARRAQILAAALACFTEQGLEAATMEQICERARCSVGSLYHHFGSKSGVASRLFVEGLADLNAGLIERLEQCESAEAGVRAVVHHYADWMTAHPELGRFLLHSRDIDFTPEARSELRTLHHNHFGAVFSWFGVFVLRGEMKQLPAETYIPIISGPVEDYARLWLVGRVRTPLAEVAGVFADAAWAAMRGPAAA